METLRPLDVPLDLAVLKLVDALRILGSDQVIEAARFFKSHQTAVVLPRKMVPEVVAELLDNRKANGKSFLHLKDLHLRLKRFADAHKMPISAVTTRDIQKFLLSLDVTGRTRLNFLRTIGTLFNFAKAQGYLPLDHPGTSQITRPSTTPSEIEVFTPEEMQKILDHSEPEGIPALVIGAFAGVRSEELKRLDWSD
jgi:integrase